jgi:nitrile hydratase beta subunit
MNGPHDMGGMHGFGRVQPEANEPVFHADWEKTVMAANGANRSLGLVNIDEFRHSIERMPPAEYLNTPYYGRWLSALERILVEKGILTAQELSERAALLQEHPDTVTPQGPIPPLAAQPPIVSNPRAAYQRPGPTPRYSPGDRVRARNVHPTGHTRLPRYARGKRGTIHQVRGVYVFPDTHAHGLGEQPQPLYTVQFDGQELWGDSTEAREAVHIDLWESYLEPDPEGTGA